MADEELDPILIQVTIPLPTPMIHRAFADADVLDQWMCEDAQVEPRVGGTYSVAFSDPPGYRSTGVIDTFTPDVDIGFSWQGPAYFAALMNRPEPKTRVYVRLQESPEGIDVTLEHMGWGSGPAWEEARSWHFQLWDERLRRLKEYLLREAYG
jgi:uncharacterized protein YndB with AHSA1/START domain